jgi:hypothetical protein
MALILVCGAEDFQKTRQGWPKLYVGSRVDRARWFIRKKFRIKYKKPVMQKHSNLPVLSDLDTI